MKKLQLSLLLSLAVLTASSQKVYFVYVQAEAEQPFFVRMKEKLYSSSGSGYIILSKLLDSTYSFSVGFPQNKWPEQNFTVAVNKKDHGYLLKNFGDKGWGLFDLQTLAVQMAVTGKAGINVPGTENKDVSAFTDILSKAADDPSLKEKPVLPKVEEKKTEIVLQEVPKKEEPKPETKEPVVTKPAEAIETAVVKKEEPKTDTKEPVVIQPAIVTETAIVKKEEPKPETKTESKETIAVSKPIEIVEQPVAKKEEPKTEEKAVEKPTAITEAPLVKQEEPKMEIKETVAAASYAASQVKKWSENPTPEGVGLVFIDTYPNGVRDTVSLIIPNPMPAVIAVKEEPKAITEEKKFIENVSADNTTQPTETVSAYKILTAPPIGTSGTNSNCKEAAVESDFFKLRKAMAAGKDDDDMLSTAKKYFKTKCFSTTQVKNLSTLFLNDEAKYRFFDLANGRVTDLYNFQALAGELRDEYYINRFKAMLRN